MQTYKSIDEFPKEIHGGDAGTYFYDLFLYETDHKVLQRIREKELGLPLTMTDEEYIALEKQRQECVEKIREIETRVVVL